MRLIQFEVYMKTFGFTHNLDTLESYLNHIKVHSVQFEVYVREQKREKRRIIRMICSSLHASLPLSTTPIQGSKAVLDRRSIERRECYSRVSAHPSSLLALILTTTVHLLLYHHTPLTLPPSLPHRAIFKSPCPPPAPPPPLPFSISSTPSNNKSL
jgi:hypothetical protein